MLFLAVDKVSASLANAIRSARTIKSLNDVASFEVAIGMDYGSIVLKFVSYVDESQFGVRMMFVKKLL